MTLLLRESHKVYEFNHPMPSLVCKITNRALAAWRETGDLNARREYAQQLRDHANGRDGALQGIDGYEYDIRYLLSRRAAPTKGRPEQCMVVFADGRAQEADQGVWRLVYDLASIDGRLHWASSVRRKDDPWFPTKWGRVELSGNEYGRLLASEEKNA